MNGIWPTLDLCVPCDSRKDNKKTNNKETARPDLAMVRRKLYDIDFGFVVSVTIIVFKNSTVVVLIDVLLIFISE